jgi:branched-chain amino acid transport system permease protein
VNDITETLRRNRTLIITLAVLAVLFLLAVQGMSTKDWTITVLRGLAVGAVIFLVASGFSIIFGLMGVLNLAHGTLFMIGAYVGWSVYVRPDTLVDILTPLALLVAGFMLMPLWDNMLGRLRLPPQVARVWPWVGLILAAVILVLTISRAPLAVWDPGVYDNSPIVWTQHFEGGQLSEWLEPARFSGMSPGVGLVVVLLGSILAAISLVGLGQRGRAAGPATHARDLPWRAIMAFLVLVVIGIGAFLANDALTEGLISLNSNWLFLIAIVVATLVGAGLGGLMEITLIRPLYERHIYQIMLTFGLGFIGIEVVRAIWGRAGFTMPKPALFAGSGDGCPGSGLGDWSKYHCSTLALSIGGDTVRIRTYNEIFIVVAGLVVLVAIWILLQRSRLGMIIRAGVQDSEMVEALGINVRRVFTLVFALGVGLAALGGALAAPSMGLSEGMGATLLLGALIALAIGGLTSYPGAAAGSVLVGLLQQFIIKYGQIGIDLPVLAEPFKPTPPLVPASTVLLMVIILLVMPQGLLGRRE